MATIYTKDISEISEVNSDATYIFTTDGKYEAKYEAKIEDLVELLEDEEDVREGLKALADEEGTITWEQYQRRRAK
jgi:hypothetical protein